MGKSTRIIICRCTVCFASNNLKRISERQVRRHIEQNGLSCSVPETPRQHSPVPQGRPMSPLFEALPGK